MQVKDIKEFGLKEKIEQENNLVKGVKVKFTILIIISNIFSFTLSQFLFETPEVTRNTTAFEAPNNHTLLKIKANLFIDETEDNQPISVMDQNEIIIYKKAIFHKKITVEGKEDEYLIYVPDSELKNFRPKNQNIFSIIPYINYIEKTVLKKHTGGSFETYL